LELRPNCELCDKDLPPHSTEACICSYECTFCADCVEQVLHNVCPNCGGGFTRRPIRPTVARRLATSLLHDPASTTHVHSQYSREEIETFVDKVKDIPPEQR
jgi:hypothetical protein